EPAAVRFNRTVADAYPLHYYRRELLLTDNTVVPRPGEPEPRIAPKPIRLAWDRLPNKTLWGTVGLLLYAMAFTTALALLSRTDPVAVAVTFFERAFHRTIHTATRSILTIQAGDHANPEPGTLAGRLISDSLQEIRLKGTDQQIRRFWLLAPTRET